MSSGQQPLPSFKGPDKVERKLGLTLPDPMYNSNIPVFEQTFPDNVLKDGDIQDILTDPRRTPRRLIFDTHWIIEGDQGQHGSCNGYAGASVLSKTRYLRGIQDGIVLSGSYVYSWINNNQDNGSALDRGMAELMAHGAPPSKMCPNTMIYRNQTQQFDAEAIKHLGLACYALTSKQGFRSAVALGYLCVVAMQVGNDFMNYKGKGTAPVIKGPGNHAMHVDDAEIIGGVENYDLVNNWNMTWGDLGRGLVTWDAFVTPFTVHQFYVITSTSEAGG